MNKYINLNFNQQVHQIEAYTRKNLFCYFNFGYGFTELAEKNFVQLIHLAKAIAAIFIHHVSSNEVPQFQDWHFSKTVNLHLYKIQIQAFTTFLTEFIVCTCDIEVSW